MFLTRSINILLIVIMFFADSGHTIYAHTCLKKKQTNISLNYTQSCCSDRDSNSDYSIKKASCCEVASKHLKINSVSEVNSINSIITLIAADIYCTTLFVIQPSTAVNAVTKNNSPPLFASVKSGNVFTQTFRI